MPRFAVVLASFPGTSSPLTPAELYAELTTKEPATSRALSFYRDTLGLTSVSLIKCHLRCCSDNILLVVTMTQQQSLSSTKTEAEEKTTKETTVTTEELFTLCMADTGLLPDECFASVEVSLCTSQNKDCPVLTLTRDPIGRKSLMYAMPSQATLIVTSGPAGDSTLTWTEAHPRFKTTVTANAGSFAVSQAPGEYPTLASWYGERQQPLPPLSAKTTEEEEKEEEKEDKETKMKRYVDQLIGALEASVKHEAVEPLLAQFPEERSIAVLFSGGLDSTVLAGVVDRCLPPDYTIELVNVAFTSAPTGGQNRTKDMYTAVDKVPDRIAGLRSLEDLRTASPGRRWVFVPVDVTEEEANAELQRVLALARPRDTYMDVTIGLPIWFAGRGIGSTGATSTARVLVVGQGADEQFAGYTRYRNAFKSGGLAAMQKELDTDMDRLWSRNLGRDDRILTDRGRFCALPFLSRSFVHFLNSVPLECICDLSLPQGVGDKLLLRMAARKLGLTNAAALAKKAIQFGSRVAKLFKQEGVTSKQARSCGAVKFEYKDDE